jgi:hypothetical protein
MSRNLPAKDWPQIKADLEAGKTITDVSKAHRVQARTIRAYGKAHGWPDQLTKSPPPKIIETSADIALPATRVKRGRPPMPYSDDAAVEICSRIASGEALTRVCQDDHLPGITTVYKWLVENATFAEHYTRARADQADTIADEIMLIADTEPDPNRAKVRIDARKWIASKLKPQRYGEKIDISGEISNKITAIRRIIVDDGAEIEGIEVHRAQALESVSQLPEK